MLLLFQSFCRSHGGTAVLQNYIHWSEVPYILVLQCLHRNCDKVQNQLCPNRSKIPKSTISNLCRLFLPPVFSSHLLSSPRLGTLDNFPVFDAFVRIGCPLALFRYFASSHVSSRFSLYALFLSSLILCPSAPP